MIGFVLRLAITALGLWLAQRLVPGIAFDSTETLVFAALLLGVGALAVRRRDRAT